MGSPPMNLIPADVRSGVLHVGDTVVTAVPTPDGPVTVGVRPEHLKLHGSYAQGMVPARVDFTEPLGSHVLVTALVDVHDDAATAATERRVIIQTPAGTDFDSGTRIGLEMPQERTYFFDAETGNVRNSRERIAL
jgi:sn-glycerol 3-phosphate transport system ATP-binding protein